MTADYMDSGVNGMVMKDGENVSALFECRRLARIIAKLTDIDQQVEDLDKLMQKLELISDKVIELRHGERLGSSDGYEFWDDDIIYTIHDRDGCLMHHEMFPMSYLFDDNWEQAEGVAAKVKREAAKVAKKKADEAAKLRQDDHEKKRMEALAKKHNMVLVPQDKE